MAANPAMVYRSLWEVLNGAASWNANPPIVVIAFTPALCNIDRIAA